MSTASPPASPDAALRSVHTANLPALFERLQHQPARLHVSGGQGHCGAA